MAIVCQNRGKDVKGNKTISMTFIRQFKHLSKMLTVAINRCPEDLWNRPETRTIQSPAWTACHAVVTLAMPHILNLPSLELPFELESGIAASKEEVRSILRGITEHVLHEYAGMTDERILNTDEREGRPGIKNLIYALRHTQHHVSEPTQILAENGVNAPAWSTANMM